MEQRIRKPLDIDNVIMRDGQDGGDDGQGGEGYTIATSAEVLAIWNNIN